MDVCIRRTPGQTDVQIKRTSERTYASMAETFGRTDASMTETFPNEVVIRMNKMDVWTVTWAWYGYLGARIIV